MGEYFREFSGITASSGSFFLQIFHVGPRPYFQLAICEIFLHEMLYFYQYTKNFPPIHTYMYMYGTCIICIYMYMYMYIPTVHLLYMYMYIVYTPFCTCTGISVTTGYIFSLDERG